MTKRTLPLLFAILTASSSTFGTEPLFENENEPFDFLTLHDDRIFFTVVDDTDEFWYAGFNVHVQQARTLEQTQMRFIAYENLKRQMDLANGTLPAHALNYLKSRTVVRLENDEYCDDEPERGNTTAWGGEFRGTKFGVITYRCFVNNMHKSEDEAVAWYRRSHLMIHELAHIWDHLVFDWENPTILNYYHSIRTCLYQDEEDLYWRLNVREFFAQMTVSHFYRTWEPPETIYTLPWDVRNLIEAAWSKTPLTDLRELRRLAIC